MEVPSQVVPVSFRIRRMVGTLAIETGPGSRQFAFVMHMGLFQLVAMMVWLCNAPSAPKRYMDTSKIKLCMSVQHVDDIADGGSDWQVFLDKLCLGSALIAIPGSCRSLKKL